MPLLFVGIDPHTGDHESPTVWVDDEKQELVFQGWKPGPELEADCAARQRACCRRGRLLPRWAG
ncbi:hypothetical protein EDD92_9835 [Streptomyces sp. TLI_185]|nr:hypothetical protein EDD92_9835 [Streptomyces sp. TLI_185]